MNLKAVQTYREKLKELKVWAQVKSPKQLQPAISYTLGWLSPELLGTGFRMTEISDFSMKAFIPAHPINLDADKQISQGLTLNGCLELARTYLNTHWPESHYRIISSEIKMIKQHHWSKDVTLLLAITEGQLDQFFIDLQSEKKAVLELSIQVQIQDSKKPDRIDLKLNCEATHLLG